MDYFDRVEGARLLGSEFLVWLWWLSEVYEDGIELPEHGVIRVWLESSLTLEEKRMELEQSKLRGAAPSTTPEARMALAQSKRPVRAQLGLASGSLEFSFVFDADGFAIAAVKLPEEIKDGSEEAFLERMHLVEHLEAIFDALYREFLKQRLAERWDASVGEAIRAWVKTGEAVAPGEHARSERAASIA